MLRIFNVVAIMTYYYKYYIIFSFTDTKNIIDLIIVVG